MKLEAQNSYLRQSGGIGESTDAGFEDNGHLFDIMSTSIYMDAIGSIVREISCNGVDSHIDAGKPNEPIVVHVPNSIEPWFSIRDFGIGLSDEQIRKLYQIYGKSTKGDSNTTTGAFGLGSKTPFAYSDQFNVVAIHDGVKRTYNAYRKEDRRPAIKQMDEILTDECNGVEVIVPVAPSDYEAFRVAVKEQLRFFKVKPTIKNVKVMIDDVHNPDFITYQSADITLYNGKYYSPETLDGLYVVQGGVGYPLNISNLKLSGTLSDFVYELENQVGYMEFPIGTISVTASREGIRYSEQTKQNIIDRLKRVQNSLADDMVKDIKALDTIWERAAFFNRLTMSSIKKTIKERRDFDIIFKGGVVSFLGDIAIDMTDFTKLPLTAKHWKKQKAFRTGSIRFERSKVENSDRYIGGAPLHAKENMKIVVMDTGKKPVVRVRHFAEQNNWPHILMIESQDGLDKMTPNMIKNIAVSLKVKERDLIKVSDLDIPPSTNHSTSNSNAGGPRPKAFRCNWDGIYSSKYWDRVYDDLDDIGRIALVRMERHNIGLSNDYRLVYNTIKAGFLSDVTLVAVNNQTWNRIQDGKVDCDYVTIADLAAELKAKQEAIVKPIFQAIYKYDAYKQLMTSEIRRYNTLRDMGVSLPEFDFSAVTNRLNMLLERVRKRNLNCLEDRDSFDFEAYTKSGQKAARARINALYERYPMLKHVKVSTFRNDPADFEDARDYVQSMNDLAELVEGL